MVTKYATPQHADGIMEILRSAQSLGADETEIASTPSEVAAVTSMSLHEFVALMDPGGDAVPWTPEGIEIQMRSVQPDFNLDTYFDYENWVENAKLAMNDIATLAGSESHATTNSVNGTLSSHTAASTWLSRYWSCLWPALLWALAIGLLFLIIAVVVTVTAGTGAVTVAAILAALSKWIGWALFHAALWAIVGAVNCALRTR